MQNASKKGREKAKAAVPPPQGNQPHTAIEKTRETLLRLGVHNPTHANTVEVLTMVEIVELAKHSSLEVKHEMVAEHRGGTVPRYGQKSSIARALGMCRNSVLPGKKRVKKNSRSTIAQWKRVAVNGFLRRSDNSCTLPDKRHYASKKRAAELGEPGQRFVVALCDTLRNLHRKCKGLVYCIYI